MRILVLGHNGMLGDAVCSYLSQQANIEVLTIDARWPSIEFKEAIVAHTSDFVINAIGKIPQKSAPEDSYEDLNVVLPQYLDTLGIPILHPSTDCEFSGTIAPGEQYAKDAPRNATDAYGSSKARASLWIEEEARNTKMLRTSIIGHESGTAVSLLDWFLSQEHSVRGYTNHYWNGVTTLEWAKRALAILNSWETQPKLIQYASPGCTSKYDLLTMIAKVYGKEISIEPFETPETVNKCLVSDTQIKPLPEQLKELASFYGKV